MVSCSACGRSRNKKSQERNITFHRFPKNQERQKKWIVFCGKLGWRAPNKCYLCSLHFAEKCFDKSSSLKMRLREDALPTFKVERIKYARSLGKDIEDIIIPEDNGAAKGNLRVSMRKTDTQSTVHQFFRICAPSSSDKTNITSPESRPSEPATQNATQGNSSHSEQVHIKEEPLEADPSDYRLYQQLRDSIKTESAHNETDSTNGDPEKHIHSISTDKEHLVNVKKEYSDSCENEISVNHKTEHIPMFESVFVKAEPFEEELPL